MDLSNLFRLSSKLWRLTWRERLWLAEAWCQMPGIQRQLNRVGYQRTRSRLEVPVGRRRRVDETDASRIAALVQTAGSRHFMKLECLPRSLWLWNRLRRLGLPSELALGVTRSGGADFQAHAWVELYGKPLDPTRATDSAASVPFQVIAGSRNS